MKKEDRRVKKTEKALAEALSKLLVDKKIQNITIRELTEFADHYLYLGWDFSSFYAIISQCAGI